MLKQPIILDKKAFDNKSHTERDVEFLTSLPLQPLMSSANSNDHDVGVRVREAVMIGILVYRQEVG
jgi:hypothetical protein